MEALLGLALVVVLGVVLVLVTRGPAPGDAALRSEIRSISESLRADAMVLNQRLEGIESRMTRTQTAGQEMAAGIFETLGDVSRATAQMAEQARSFTSLQELLGAPKPRGGLGEAMLEEMLRQVLPPSAYSTQYRFADGAIVDAVVRAGDQLVCIDSKFPLANYQKLCEAGTETERRSASSAFARDVYKHVGDISSRYILPDEGTLDFALMYVPAEGVYSEVLRAKHAGTSLFELALDARVIPMAPLTFYGYLQTLLLGLKCLKIGDNATQVLRSCERLHREVESFAADYEVLGRHLTNARGKYEDTARGLARLRSRVERTIELGDGDDRPALEAVEAMPER